MARPPAPDKILSQHLIRLARWLQDTDTAIDLAAARWILAHEQEDRKEAGQRAPRVVMPRGPEPGLIKVRLAGGQVAWLPAEPIKEALERAEREAEDG